MDGGVSWTNSVKSRERSAKGGLKEREAGSRVTEGGGESSRGFVPPPGREDRKGEPCPICLRLKGRSNTNTRPVQRGGTCAVPGVGIHSYPLVKGLPKFFISVPGGGHPGGSKGFQRATTFM